ncbi:MAG: hypothetical protein ACRDMJ_15835 [Solirubrobacteraceae bacterium]
MSGRARRSAAALGASLAATLLAVASSPALAAGPPSLPGPPPGLGQGLPLPPPPGQAPPPQSPAPALTLGGAPRGPGLLSSFASPHGRQLPVRIACQGNGAARLRAGAISAGAAYRCAAGRATIRFTLTKAAASTISRGTGATGSLTLRQGAVTVKLSLSLARSAPAPQFWVSAFGLSCGGGGGGVAQLLAPNFSAGSPTTIDVRPWLAWYTAATGWQWQGTLGAGRSSWYRWTATPGGVAEWAQPAGITPWTWGPIDVAPDHGTYVIGVLEAIYWYSHPNDVWAYARSRPDQTSTSAYCAYP